MCMCVCLCHSVKRSVLCIHVVCQSVKLLSACCLIVFTHNSLCCPQYLQRDLRNRFESDIDQELLLQVAFQVRYSPKKLKK